MICKLHSDYLFNLLPLHSHSIGWLRPVVLNKVQCHFIWTFKEHSIQRGSVWCNKSIVLILHALQHASTKLSGFLRKKQCPTPHVSALNSTQCGCRGWLLQYLVGSPSPNIYSYTAPSPCCNILCKQYLCGLLSNEMKPLFSQDLNIQYLQ